MLNQPLVFEPIVKSNVWGGDFLRSRSVHAPAAPVGESWEIADHGADTTRVSSGPCAGKTLHELLPQICGRAVDPASPSVFPLLLKIIDPHDDLSVQVHPDDAYAGRQKAGELGKTEAWFILSAEPGAKIYRGLKPGVTKAEFAAAIRNGTCADCLKAVPVRPGDVAFLPSGMIHALCGGVRIAEIQQNSDTTYRVFDWNRVGLDGKPRELHIDHAIAVSDFSGVAGPDLCAPSVLNTAGCRHERFLCCEKFAFERLSAFTGPVTLDTGGNAFHILTTTCGNSRVCSGGASVERTAYDSVLIPAGAGRYTVEAAAGTELLLFYRPV